MRKIDLPDRLEVRGTNFTLRDWQPTDAPALEPICGAPAVTNFTTLPTEYRPELAHAWIERQHDRRRDGSGLILAIVDSNENVAGNVNLIWRGKNQRTPWLGYWLIPEHRGKGLASSASALICAWGFANLGLTRIDMAIVPGNLPSRRLAERIGAKQVGTRDWFLAAEDRTLEMVVYSLEPAVANQ